jgi:cystine transport system substrate-binding protein
MSGAVVAFRAVHGRNRRLAAAFVVAAVAAVGVSVLPAAGAEARDRADELRQADGALAERSRAAVLELYALESQVASARESAAAARARVDAVSRERAAVAHRLRVARRSLAAAQAGLGERLRALYEHGGTDPLSIILGSESIEDALATIDGLGFAAEQDRTLVARTKRARVQLTRAERRLDRRAAELAVVVERAEATVAALAARQAERAAFVRSLARERSLKAGQIAALERQATEAQTRSAAVAAEPGVAQTAVLEFTPTGAAAPPTEAPTAGRSMTVSATAYALRGRTATGLPTSWGVAAVDPSVIPLGTRFFVPGYGEAVAADTGSAVQGAEIDLWFPSTAQALAWGRRTVTIVIH